MAEIIRCFFHRHHKNTHSKAIHNYLHNIYISALRAHYLMSLLSQNLFDRDRNVYKKALAKWPTLSSIRELDLSNPYASATPSITVAIDQILGVLAPTLTSFRMCSSTNTQTFIAALPKLINAVNLESLELECDSIPSRELSPLWTFNCPKLCCTPFLPPIQPHSPSTHSILVIRLPSVVPEGVVPNGRLDFANSLIKKMYTAFPLLKNSLCVQLWIHTSFSHGVRWDCATIFSNVAETETLIKNYVTRGRLGEYTRLLSSVAEHYLSYGNLFQTDQLLQKMLIVDPTSPTGPPRFAPLFVTHFH